MTSENSLKESEGDETPNERRRKVGKRSVAFRVPEKEKEEEEAKNGDVQKDEKAEKKKPNKAIKSGRRYSEAEKAFLSRVNVSKGKEKSEEELQRNAFQACWAYVFDPTGKDINK